MLIHPQLGSWTVIGSLVTDLEIGEPAEGLSDGCGSCRRCSTDCPTGALGEFGVLDANKCLAWLLQAKGAFPRDFRRSLGGRIYGCDDCQVTCPYNCLLYTSDAADDLLSVDLGGRRINKKSNRYRGTIN